MDWRQTALVTGLTLAGAWVARTPAPQPGADLATAGVARRAVARRDDASVPDIEAEARRLETRLSAVGTREFAAGSRNPFRFTEAARPRAVAPLLPEAPVTVADSAPEPPALRLIGLAVDETDGRVSRTAILSGMGGVWTVKAGESVGEARVTTVDADAVELSLPDGARVRLTFRP